MALAERAHRFTSEEYRRLVLAGALDDLPVELLDGMLVDMSPQGEEHARIVQRLMVALGAQLRRLRVQMPLDVAEGWVPEPDLAVADPHRDPRRHPTTALLAVEVAVTSQAVDERKAAVYAAAAIATYWLVDVPRRQVVVHEEPRPDGHARVTTLRAGDALDARLDGVAPLDVAALLA